MKIKKPSLNGQKNCEYLGRFKKDKFIQDGHNTFGPAMGKVMMGQTARMLEAISAARRSKGPQVQVPTGKQPQQPSPGDQIEQSLRNRMMARRRFRPMG